MEIARSAARKLALYRQGLDGHRTPSSNTAGVLEVIERLGYVQIDTISVVRRAHHHTFWVRVPNYQMGMLQDLQSQDRQVFEWWASAMSLVPMRDYRYYATRMDPKMVRSWHRNWYAENKDIVADVLDRIRTEGPLTSSDFKSPEGFKRGGWWSWKPAKTALEVLFDMGEVMVAERRNFRRVYDLRERVVPSWVDTSTPTQEEMDHWVIQRALCGLGFAPVDDVRWGRWKGIGAAAESVHQLGETGEVVTFEIEGEPDRTFCALRETLDAVMDAPDRDPELHILCPFDNLVIQRGWLSRYFGFQYKLEAYTPAAKRKYGYYVLPILWGDRFVGRLDAKADRKARTLIVRKLFFEPGFEDCETYLPALVHKLRDLAQFSGCDQVVVETVIPEQAHTSVGCALAAEA